MPNIDNKQEISELLNNFLMSLPLPGHQITSIDVEKGQLSKQILLSRQLESVPILLDRLSDPDFVVKDACYDLILEMGSSATGTLIGELGKRGPIMDIWIATMLKFLGNLSAMDQLWQQLEHPDEHVRHLTALALAFQDLDAPKWPDKLYPVLIDALKSERSIEGTPFTVAGSALGCLIHMSGENFLSTPQEIVFYNYEHFVYPPPLHPFPFAADHFSKVGKEEQQDIRQRVEAWWSRQLTSAASE